MKHQNLFKLKAFLLYLSIFLIQFSLFAETVILRSHEVIHGKITFQDANVLKMNDDFGKPLELQKNDILKVSYRDVKDAKELKKIIEEEESKLPPEKRKKIAKIEQRKSISIVWRSALVPGWGQWKAGKKWIGAVSFLGVLGAMGYAGTQFRAFDTADKSYKLESIVIASYILNESSKVGSNPITSLGTGVILGQATFKPYDDAATLGNQAQQILIGVFAIQLIHSYIIGRAWEKEDPNTTIGNKAVYGDWNIKAFSRQSISSSGSVAREPLYEVNYAFRF